MGWIDNEEWGWANLISQGDTDHCTGPGAYSLWAGSFNNGMGWIYELAFQQLDQSGWGDTTHHVRNTLTLGPFR